MIAIGGYYGEPLGSIESEVESYVDMGLAGMKFKVGGASPEADVAHVRRARAAGGDNFILAVDANQGYSVPDALRFCRLGTDLDIRWFEEPVGWANDRRDLVGPLARGHPRRRRPDRILGRRVPRADGSRRHRPLQLRRLVVGRPDRLAHAAAVASTFGVEMAHHEEPQV